MDLEIRIQSDTNVANTVVRKGRSIVICCDGTGNQFGEPNSNVVKLYQTLAINEKQRGYYHPGVGTMGAPKERGHLDKEWTRAQGLAFGTGRHPGKAICGIYNVYSRCSLCGDSEGNGGQTRWT